MYELVLKKENSNKYKWFFLIVIVLNLLVLLYFFYTKKINSTKVTIITICAISAIILELITKKNIGIISLLVLFCSWLTTPFFFIAIVPLLFWLYLYDVNREKKFIFKNDSIISPDILKQKNSWTEFENIVLKDGLLTLDYKNNKLLQIYITQEGNAQYEKSFNQFCQQQITNCHH